MLIDDSAPLIVDIYIGVSLKNLRLR